MNDSSKTEDLDYTNITVESLMELDFEGSNVKPLPEEMTIWDKKNYTKSWKDEDWDDLVPKDGFLHDFVLAHRGYAAPTAFWLWSGITAVSTMLGRDAWMAWGSGQMFANFYTLLVGPAGRVKKSTAIMKAQEIIQDYVDYIPNEAIQFQKRTPCLLGKASEASLYMVMENQKKTVLDDVGNSITVESDGKIFACINELATFLSKASYSSGIVEKLTDMYDCKRKDSETTRSRGMNSLSNIYATFIGGVTPDGLKDSIPESAFGGGFMSRLTTVYCKKPTRIFPKPVKLIGVPSADDLKIRLAWLAVRARGEYDLSESAYNYYADWYYRWDEEQEANPDDRSLSHRQDVITLKLATIICSQRYNHPVGMEHVITKKDYIMAEKILEKTLRSSADAMDTVGESQFFYNVGRVKTSILNYSNKNNGDPIPRAKLLRKMSSKRINAKIVNECLQQLISTDEIIVTRNGKVYSEYSTATKETYGLVGGV
jgi:hypothetical protein